MLSSLFAWRYFRTKRTTHAINLISWISVVAITVVTAALIVVMSVFNGFEDLVKSLYSDFYADIKVQPVRGKWLQTEGEAWQRLSSLQGVATWSAVVEERAVLMHEEEKTMVWLKGVAPDYPLGPKFDRHIMRGKYATGDSAVPALVLGAGVENALQVASGQSLSPVTIYLPNRLAGSNADMTEALHSANLYPAGSFAIQQEFDNQYALTDVDFMRYMLDLKRNECTAAEVQIAAGANADEVAKDIRQLLGNGVEVKTRYQQNQALFAAMQMEKLIIFGVAFLILLIAAFNIISALTMTVIEKQQDIAVLGAMGASPLQVQLVYLKLAGIMAGVGGIMGFLLGWLIAKGQQTFHWVKLGGDSFIIDHYPVAMRISDFVWVGLIIAIVALLAGYFPSRRAAAIQYSLKS